MKKKYFKRIVREVVVHKSHILVLEQRVQELERIVKEHQCHKVQH